MIQQTVQATVDQARRYADQETLSPAADFTTDAGDFLALFTFAQRRLLDLVIASDGAELIATSTTLNAPYLVPADFYHLIAVERRDSDPTYWRTLNLANFHERNFYRDVEFPSYRILNAPGVGPAITLFPANAAPGELRLWYVPLHALPWTLGDSYDAYGGWDDYVALDMAIAAVAKEDRDTSALRTMLGDATKRVKQSCQSTALTTPEKIADVARYPEQSYDWRRGRAWR